MWTESADTYCSNVGRTAALIAIWTGFATSVAAFPIGIVLMLVGRAAPRWLAVPVAVVALATVAVGFTQLTGESACLYDGRDLTYWLGVYTLIGAAGLAGLTASVLQPSRVES